MEKHALDLNPLARLIADAGRTGVITFDRDLRVVDRTPLAGTLLEIRPTLDATLAAGTDPNIWGNWRDLLATPLTTAQPAVFDAVKYTRADGTRLLNLVCSPYRDPRRGDVTGGVVLVSDVTDKLGTDHELAQAERLMAIGKVAANVAHELNNPLDGIQRYVNLSLRILDQNEPDKARQYLEHCRTGLQRMGHIISEMLEFSRCTHLAFETSPVDKLIDDALRAMDTSLRGIEVRIRRDETGPLPHLKSDAVFQVFCNLIKNAADAMGDRGVLTITLSQTAEDCRIEFCDTGPGIITEPIDDIFKPFYTTKPKGQGTGLGLAICQDILEKLNGAVSARNLPDGGACLLVRLPCGVTPSTRSTR